MSTRATEKFLQCYYYYCVYCIVSRINLHVKQGELVAVVGHVGAGKSSLVQGLLGEMEKVVGNVTIKVCGLQSVEFVTKSLL